MQDRLRSIYADYHRVLTSHLAAERALLANAEVVANALYGRFDLGPLADAIVAKPALGAEIQAAYRDVHAFWRARGPELIEILSNEFHGLKIAIPNQRQYQLRNLPIYFDTVLVQDAFHISQANPEYVHVCRNLPAEQRLWRWTTSLADYLGTCVLVEEIVRQDLDYPLYLVCPRPILLAESAAPDLDRVNEITGALSFEFLGEYLEPGRVTNYRDYFHELWADRSGKARRVYERLRREGIVLRLAASSRPSLSSYVDQASDPSHPFQEAVFEVVTIDMARFGAVVDLQEHATAFGAVTGSSESEWHAMLDSTRTQQRRLALSAGFSKEHAVLRTIDRGRIEMFDRISRESLVRFREHGVMEEVRSFFRTRTAQLGVATLDQYESVCDEVERDFYAVLSEESNAVKRDEQALRRKLRLSAGSFLASTALGITTAAYPSLAAVGTAAAVLSAIFGTASAREVINRHLSNQKRVRELTYRPITVFQAAMNANEDSTVRD